MNRFWFKSLVIALAAMNLGLVAFPRAKDVESYQGVPTPAGVVVTVTYTDPMNVRGGPGTFYDIIGQLFPGDVRQAIGISPGREWIEISFDGGPGGIGWVYSSYVVISGGELQVVEAPPTPTPLVTPTFDPTLAAAFHLTPTQTRLPTFTPPPPITPIDFAANSSPPRTGIPSGYFIIILGVFGLIGLGISFISRQ